MAAERKAEYEEAKAQFDFQADRLRKEMEFVIEQGELSQQWNEFHASQQILSVMQTLVNNIDPENTKDIEKLNKKITESQADLVKIETNVSNQQNLLTKKQNAFYRKNETEDMRRHINSLKAEIKDEEKHLAHVQADMAEINAALEKITDPLQKGELKVNLKLLELDETDTKARITNTGNYLAEQ